MKYKILESKRQKLNGYVEAETFDEVINLIGNTYQLDPLGMRAFCEKKHGDLVYIIFNGSSKLAELKTA